MNTLMLVPLPLSQRLLSAFSDMEHLPRGRTLGDIVVMIDEQRACKTVDQSELASRSSAPEAPELTE